MIWHRAWAAVLLTVAGGCGEDTVTVELVFPSETHFVNSSNAELISLQVGEGQENLCPSITRQAEEMVLPRASEYSGLLSVCAFRAGVLVRGVDSGLHLLIAVVRANDLAPLLSGCAARDVVDDSSRVRIALQETSRYLDYFPPGSEPMCNAVERCDTGCP